MVFRGGRGAYRSVLCALVMLAVPACTSSIGNRVALNEANLQIGVTHKSAVAEMLGFPVAMDREPGRELWAYSDTPQLAGLYYGVPVSSTTAFMYDVTFYHSRPGFEDAALVCVFDTDGVLESVHWNKDLQS